jgi:hypothetical protein
MMLLTKANRRALPKLRATEKVAAEKKIAQVKFFNPCGRGTWYAVEFDGVDTFFGYVVSPLGDDCNEWGYFSLAELSQIRLRFGLGIERDRHFAPGVVPELQ